MDVRELLKNIITKAYQSFSEAFSQSLQSRFNQIDSILTDQFTSEFENLISNESTLKKYSDQIELWRLRCRKEIERQLFSYFNTYYESGQFTPVFRYISSNNSMFPPPSLIQENYNVYWTNNPSQSFIHRNLGSFLKNELNLTIVNEIFGDFTQCDPPIKIPLFIRFILLEGQKHIFKIIGNKIIEILTEIEKEKCIEWEKQYRVKSDQFCLSLKFIPEDLYPTIVNNHKQLEEWKNLYPNMELLSFIAECKDTSKKISNSMVTTFLKKNLYLPIDTRYFASEFQRKICDLIPEFDKKINGSLYKGENWHILKSLIPDFSNRCICIYIDPPYNTGNEGFLYNDKMPHYAWLVMMQNRLEFAKELLHPNGVLYCSIDDNEQVYLKLLIDSIFGSNMPNIIWHKKTQPSFLTKELIPVTEYILAAKKNPALLPLWGSFGDKEKPTELINISNQVSIRKFPADYVIFANGWSGELQPGWYGKDKLQVELLTSLTITNGKADQNFQLRSRFKWQQERIDQEVQKGGIIHIKSTNSLRPTIARHYDDEIVRAPTTLLSKKVDDFPTNTDANREMKDFFGISPFDYPKPTSLIRFLISTVTYYQQDYILDFFGGSGTTAQAVIEQNEFDGKQRKYILIEREQHFDSVLLPRIKKVMFSKTWKDGTPQDSDGHFQIIRLIESN